MASPILLLRPDLRRVLSLTARARVSPPGRCLCVVLCLSSCAPPHAQEGVTVLRQMLEMEAWQRVPVPSQVSILDIASCLNKIVSRGCPLRRFGCDSGAEEMGWVRAGALDVNQTLIQRRVQVGAVEGLSRRSFVVINR